MPPHPGLAGATLQPAQMSISQAGNHHSQFSATMPSCNTIPLHGGARVGLSTVQANRRDGCMRVTSWPTASIDGFGSLNLTPSRSFRWSGGFWSAIQHPIEAPASNSTDSEMAGLCMRCDGERKSSISALISGWNWKRRNAETETDGLDGGPGGPDIAGCSSRAPSHPLTREQ